MPPSISAQASQAAAQGQQQLANYNSQAANYGNQYGADTTQAQAAGQAVQDYTKGMQGAYDATTGNGNAGSAYTYGLNQALTGQGYNADEMTNARNNLNQSQGALSAYSDYANQAASKFGLNAGGFAAANSGALSGLNNNIAAQQGAVNNLTTIYGQAQTGANQFAGAAVQGQQNTLGGLQNVYKNASDQQASALSQMQFYDGLAQKQGGLNATNASAYASAQSAYAAASQAMAQASLLTQQQQHQAALYSDQASQAAASNAAANGQELSSSAANRGLTAAINNGAPTYNYSGVTF